VTNDLFSKLNQLQVDTDDLNNFEEQTTAAIPEGAQVAICALGNVNSLSQFTHHRLWSTLQSD
jgi:hypothetical protein